MEGCPRVPHFKMLSIIYLIPSLGAATLKIKQHKPEYQRPPFPWLLLIYQNSVSSRLLSQPEQRHSSTWLSQWFSYTVYLERVHADGTGSQLLIYCMQLLHESTVPGLLGLWGGRGPHGHHLSTDVPDGRCGDFLSLIKKGNYVKKLEGQREERRKKEGEKRGKKKKAGGGGLIFPMSGIFLFLSRAPEKQRRCQID